MLRTLAALPLAAAASCLFEPREHRRAYVPIPAGWEGMILFPRAPGRPVPDYGANLLPVRGLPRCADAPRPDGTWRAVPSERAATAGGATAGAATMGEATVAARVPPGWAAVHMAAGWWHDTTHSTSDRTAGFASAWVATGTQPGYPSLAVPDDYRQTAFTECVSDIPYPGSAIAEYTLEAPAQQTHYVVAAVWPLTPGRWGAFMGLSLASRDVPQLRAILATARVAGE
ncbi:MAG: hypothetical protein JO180_07895 [Gemmatirosa sp.]|nr:hypothetical protein [Gemmatirosa sp.]